MTYPTNPLAAFDELTRRMAQWSPAVPPHPPTPRERLSQHVGTAFWHVGQTIAQAGSYVVAAGDRVIDAGDWLADKVAGR